MSLLDKIVWAPIAVNQYYREETEKHQIYIHHTAGGPDPYSVINWWDSTPARVGTSFIVGGKPIRTTLKYSDGEILQCFNTRYWAYHLGLKTEHLNIADNPKSNLWLNSKSIGIELCNWGPLIDGTGSGVPFVTLQHEYPVDEDQVIEYSVPYKGFKYYQKYTDAQLDSLREILIYLCDYWDIPKEFKGRKMFQLDKRAIEGDFGVWTHTSVRPDKFDCHPQPELIQILESL